MDAEKTRLDDQAIHASCLQNMEEAHKGIIQRKCQKIEALKMSIEEKKIRAAVEDTKLNIWTTLCCRTVVAKQFQCVPFYQSQPKIRHKYQILNLGL